MVQNKLRICLIALFPKIKFNLIGESQGICSIASYLLNNYNTLVDVKVFDQQIHTNDEIINGIGAYCDIIGFSVKMGTYPEFENLYKEITNKNIRFKFVVLGNSFAHFNSKLIISKYPEIIISYGEGEVSFNGLVEHLLGQRDLSKIYNIGYLEDGTFNNTEFRFLDPNEISNSYRDNSIRFYKNNGEIYIEGSRGCAYCGCSICECRYFLGSIKSKYKWRPRNVENIISDVKELLKLSISEVTFADEDFIGNDEDGIGHSISFASKLITENIKILYRINCRVKSIYSKYDTPEIKQLKINNLSILKKSGLCKIFLGFESGSASQLLRYNKGFTISEFLRAKDILDSLGINYELGFISFDPLMSLAELKETIDFIKAYDLCSKVSSVFKELRIQGGNILYLERIKKYERESGDQLIDDYDTNEQIYPIIKYADESVNFIVKAMKLLTKFTYSQYYDLRIATQYESIHDNISEVKILKIRNHELEVILKLIQMVEEGNYNWNIVETYINSQIEIRRKILEFT